ncbi:Ig-like domain-containing protein, partial [Pseudomonas aeruginosa]|uniref:Ig-like domain-containing protein n=1 Tax=Pseudomonas aeruginosa TaxID=287 RepID=UPI0013792B1E
QNGKVIAEGTFDANGKGSVQLPPDAGGKNVTVAINEAGKESNPVTQKVPEFTSTADKPAPPSDIAIDPNTGKLSAQGKPGAKLVVKDQNGKVIVEGTFDANGKGSVQLPPSLGSGKVNVSTVGGSGIESSAVDVVTPVFAPQKVEFDANGTHVSATGKPGDVIRVSDFSGKILGSAVVRPDGTANIEIPQQSSGTQLKVTAHHGNETSPSTLVTSPIIDPERPDVPSDLSISSDASTISGKGRPGETIIVTSKDGQKIASETLKTDGDGSFAIKIPPVSAQQVKVTASKNGKESDPIYLVTPVLDGKAPPPPSDVEIDPTGQIISGKGTPGDIALIQLATGNKILGQGVVGVDGHFKIKIPAQPSGEVLNVSVRHGEQVSTPTKLISPYASGTPNSLHFDESGTQLSGEAKAGDLIRVKNSEGKIIGAGVTKSDGTFQISIPAQLAGQKLLVTAQGNGPESSPEVVLTPVIDIERPSSPEAILDSTGTILSGKAKSGSAIKIKDTAGNNVGTPIQVKADGTFEGVIPQQPAGTKLLVISELNGKQSLPTELITPVIDDENPPPPSTVQIDATGSVISGKATPNDKIIVNDKNGKKVAEGKTNAQGEFDIKVPVQHGGDELNVYVSHGNKLSSPKNVIAPYQLPSETTNIVEAGLVVDKGAFEKVEQKKLTFVTVGSSILNYVVEGGVTKSYEFRVEKGEVANISVALEGAWNLGVLNVQSIVLYKDINGEWIETLRTNEWTAANISEVAIGTSAQLSKEIVDPGEYKLSVSSFDTVGVGVKTATVNVIKKTPDGFVTEAKTATGDLTTNENVKITEVNGKKIAKNGSEIEGKYGVLKISQTGEYTYTPTKIKDGIGAADVFTYKVEHKNGEMVVNTLEVRIVDAEKLALLENPAETSSSIEIAGSEELSKSTTSDKLLINNKSANQGESKPAAVTLDELTKAHEKTGEISIDPNTKLDLPDSWKVDGNHTSYNNDEYLHYINTANLTENVWVQSGVTVI